MTEFALTGAMIGVLLGAAALIGLTKTAIPGLGVIAVSIFAGVMPTKASTAAVLLLFLTADVFATWKYRRHANWRLLLRLLPAVLLGLAFGAVFLAFASDLILRRAIGIIIVVLTVVSIVQKLRRGARGTPRTSAAPVQTPRVLRYGYGALSGFTTMVANAGGAAMSLYLLANKLPVISFLGTTAWFFAVVNLTKLPILIGLGLVTPSVLQLSLLLIPGLLVGIAVGYVIAHRIRQQVFEWLVLSLTLIGGGILIVQ